MGIATFPAASGGLSSVVRSIQRGTAASSGNVTISLVDMSKSMVNSFSTASTGTVAASGAISAANGTASAFTTSAQSGSATGATGFARYGQSQISGATLGLSLNAQTGAAQNVALNTQNLSGGTTNLIAGVNGAYLSTSTNLVVTGPCRYEVVEYI